MKVWAYKKYRRAVDSQLACIFVLFNSAHDMRWCIDYDDYYADNDSNCATNFAGFLVYVCLAGFCSCICQQYSDDA